MRSEPQATAFCPDPANAPLARRMAPRPAAEFPRHILRFRNDRRARAIGLETIERMWDAIDERGDRLPLNEKIATIRSLGSTLGEPSARQC